MTFVVHYLYWRRNGGRNYYTNKEAERKSLETKGFTTGKLKMVRRSWPSYPLQHHRHGACQEAFPGVDFSFEKTLDQPTAPRFFTSYTIYKRMRTAKSWQESNLCACPTSRQPFPFQRADGQLRRISA